MSLTPACIPSVNNSESLDVNSEDIELIRSHPLFQGLSDKQAEGVLTGLVPRDYPKGYMLFSRGDEMEYFYFIFDGWVKVFRESVDGNEAIIGVFARGETIAEAIAFVGGDYPASAEIIEQARVLPIRASTFVRYLKENPEVGLSMLSTLSVRMHHLVGEIESLKTQTGSQRVCQFLLKLCSVQEGAAVIALPYDKSVISGRLGIQPESLSRIFAKLRKLGVKTERGRVVISDVELLQRFCDGEAEVMNVRRA